mgnify:CR=1 FL=1
MTGWNMFVNIFKPKRQPINIYSIPFQMKLVFCRSVSIIGNWWYECCRSRALKTFERTVASSKSRRCGTGYLSSKSLALICLGSKHILIPVTFPRRSLLETDINEEFHWHTGDKRLIIPRLNYFWIWRLKPSLLAYATVYCETQEGLASIIGKLPT